MDIPEINLEFVFQIHMLLGQREKMGPLPSGGNRGFVQAAGGEITGPRLQGRVVPGSGGDYALYRDDNTVMFSAHYMLEAADGTLIYMRNRGFRHAPPDIAAKMEALEPVEPTDYYMRLAPEFDAPIGPHDWLTRHVFVGAAVRHADHSVFSYFLVN